MKQDSASDNGATRMREWLKFSTSLNFRAMGRGEVIFTQDPMLGRKKLPFISENLGDKCKDKVWQDWGDTWYYRRQGRWGSESESSLKGTWLAYWVPRRDRDPTKEWCEHREALCRQMGWGRGGPGSQHASRQSFLLDQLLMSKDKPR